MKTQRIDTGKNDSFRTELIQLNITADLSPYTINEKSNALQVDTTGGDVDIYLIPLKKPIHIVRQIAGAEIITIYPPVGTTGLIDGQSSITLDNQYDGVTLMPFDVNSFYAQYWKDYPFVQNGSGERRQITISTTAPASPRSGDIWFDIS